MTANDSQARAATMLSARTPLALTPDVHLSLQLRCRSVLHVYAGRLEIRHNVWLEHECLATHSYLRAGDVWCCPGQGRYTLLSTCVTAVVVMMEPDNTLRVALAWSVAQIGRVARGLVRTALAPMAVVSKT